MLLCSNVLFPFQTHVETNFVKYYLKVWSLLGDEVSFLLNTWECPVPSRGCSNKVPFGKQNADLPRYQFQYHVFGLSCLGFSSTGSSKRSNNSMFLGWGWGVCWSQTLTSLSVSCLLGHNLFQDRSKSYSWYFLSCTIPGTQIGA